MSTLDAAVDAVREDIVELRHDIHRYPEAAFEEVKTQERIMNELSALGLEPKKCAKTGVIADLGSGSGRTVALRADIDCLRMTEANPDLPYRSQRDGFAHMCGHDGHTSMLLGAAKLLAPRREAINGRVRFVFQPAEEGPGGAPIMIEQGALDGVDEIYGLHNWPKMPLGELRVVSGPIMAHVCTMNITVHGKGGHASQPHATIDPILAAAHIVTALQSIVSRNVHYKDTVVVSVTMFHAGEIHNVIPDSVELCGSIRVLTEDDYQLVEKRVREIASQIAAGMGATCEFDFDRMYPALINHPAETEHVQRVGEKVFGAGMVKSDELPMLGAEDFAYFTQKKPGCYFFLGGGQDGLGNALCHATDYDFNDNLVPHGIAMWVRLVEDRLGSSLYD